MIVFIIAWLVCLSIVMTWNIFDIHAGQKVVNNNADKLNVAIKRITKLEEDHGFLLEVLEKQNEVILRLDKRLKGCEMVMFPHKYTIITSQEPSPISPDSPSSV